MYPITATDLHIELTDKCQASCPMCARNYNGGKERPFVGQHDISIEQFKSWFPVEFLKQLKNFYACGNYGDPIIAKDCLEIFKYVRSINPTTRLSLHTNGSARSTAWWQELAEVLGDNHDVVFGIDGFESSHVLYRRGTDWNKIINNARAFIGCGGVAKIDCLVFEHNKQEIELFEKEMLALGFAEINFKFTSRFYDMTEFPVENNAGKVEYYLKPSTTAKSGIPVLKLDDISNDISIWTDMVEKTSICARCVSSNEIYVDSRGTVYPCCWVGSDMLEQPVPVKLAIHDLRNKLVENTKSQFKQFEKFNLSMMTIVEILKSPDWEKVNNVNSEKPWICAKNCRTL